MVYVDDAAYKQYGKTRCHLFADSVYELLGFYAKLGLRRQKFIKSGWFGVHYNLSYASRKRSIKLGAKPVTLHQGLMILECLADFRTEARILLYARRKNAKCA